MFIRRNLLLSFSADKEVLEQIEERVESLFSDRYKIVESPVKKIRTFSLSQDYLSAEERVSFFVNLSKLLEDASDYLIDWGGLKW